EPDLAASRKARDRVPEALERDLGDDPDGRGVQLLGDLDAGEGGAHEDAAALVDDQPRGAGRAVPDEAAPGVALDGAVDGARVDAGLARGSQRVTDGGDLRLGEDHAGRARAVQE